MMSPARSGVCCVAVRIRPMQCCVGSTCRIASASHCRRDADTGDPRGIEHTARRLALNKGMLMTRRGQFLLAAAALFTVVNLVGGVYAAVQREPMHSGLHAALTLLGAYLVWRLAPGRFANRMYGRSDAAVSEISAAMSDRLVQLEQSVGDVAIEVERIGEGQRFMNRVLEQNDAARSEEKDRRA